MRVRVAVPVYAHIAIYAYCLHWMVGAVGSGARGAHLAWFHFCQAGSILGRAMRAPTRERNESELSLSQGMGIEVAMYALFLSKMRYPSGPSLVL